MGGAEEEKTVRGGRTFRLPALPNREGLDPSFGKFDGWMRRYFKAGVDQRGLLIGEGITLAEERRVAMKALIPADPAGALQNAIPMVVRQHLPEGVLSKLEERISARGFYGVAAVVPESGKILEKSPYRRQAVLEDGTRYEVYTFGARLAQVTTAKSVMRGVAVDRVMALHEKRVRPLENGETPDPKKPVEAACPVSGKAVLAAAKEGTLPPITQETPAAEVAGRIYYLCEGGHIVDLEQKVTAAEGGSGGGIKPIGSAGGRTWGPKTLLYIRAAFPDTLKEPQSEAAAYEMLRASSDFLIENSYGKLSLVPTVTPLLILTKTEAYYTQKGNEYELRDDALALAREMGYDVDSYDLDTVAYIGGPGGFKGMGYVGAKGVWIKGISSQTECHELGHNFGVWHSNFWDTEGRSVIGMGRNVEYGNVFDVMGTANYFADGHFCAQFKSTLGWLNSDQTIERITRSGVYRLTAFDQPRLETGKRYALVIPKDDKREYWAEFRQRSQGGNLSIRDGIVLNFAPWGGAGSASVEGSNGGVQLLDTTPGSRDGVKDAPLVIGRTYSDLDSNIHITPVGKAGTVPESIDVVVNLGPFPLNHAPTLSLSASSSNVAVGGSMTFAASAADVDGDRLSYAWYFSDQTFNSANLPVATKSFSVEGDYTVRCVVSDMKGGTATQSLAVRVGNPQTFSVSGWVRSGTLGIVNARVSNSATGGDYREAFSGADGSYTLTGLNAGTHTLKAAIGGLSTSPAFSNPVTVTSNRTDINFSSISLTAVSIVAVEPVAVEGTSQKGKFVIFRDKNLAAALTVNLSRPGGTAVEGLDYAGLSTLVSGPTGRKVTIPAGMASVSVEVSALADKEVEVDETVVLSILPGTSYELGMPPTAIVHVRDLETVIPVVRIERLTASVREGFAAAAWRVSRTAPMTAPIRVRLGVSGSATEGEDYQPIAREVEIPAGQDAVDVGLVALMDGVSEGTETVALRVESGSGYQPVSGSFGSVSVSILDADTSSVRVQASVPTTTEGAASPGEFTVTRSGNLSRAVVVNFSLTGTALQGRDYEPVTNFVQFYPGQSTARVLVQPMRDGMGEPQQSVTLQIASSTDYEVESLSSATVQILDSGSVPVVTLGAVVAAAVEPGAGGTATKGVFRFTAAGSGTGTIQVKYALTGAATSGVDFAPLSGVLTMNRSGSKDLEITPLLDELAEDWETVTVTLLPDAAYSFFFDASATLRIADSTLQAVSVSAARNAKEGATTGSFWISRTGATTSPLVVSYTLGGSAGNGVDYVALPGNVTIPVGKSGAEVVVSPIDDSLAEGSETVELTLVQGAYGLGESKAVVWIEDNEGAGAFSVSVSFASAAGQGLESIGVVQVPVQLSAPSPRPVSVEVYLGTRPWDYFKNLGGKLESAVLGVDYQVSLGLLTFTPGETTKRFPSPFWRTGMHNERGR